MYSPCMAVTALIIGDAGYRRLAGLPHQAKCERPPKKSHAQEHAAPGPVWLRLSCHSFRYSPKENNSLKKLFTAPPVSESLLQRFLRHRGADEQLLARPPAQRNRFPPVPGLHRHVYLDLAPGISEVAFTDIGGWDTHVNQLAGQPAEGQMANTLKDF